MARICMECGCKLVDGKVCHCASTENVMVAPQLTKTMQTKEAVRENHVTELEKTV